LLNRREDARFTIPITGVLPKRGFLVSDRGSVAQ
jgi:hypothetical protein